jgi:DNA-binding transcriptional LysR family regulator
MGLSSIQLEAFLTVAQTLNFTRAAEQLCITQSALSQRIMKLEGELETSLFIRDRAGLKLTEAAQNLVRYCRCKNSLEEEFLSGLRGQELAGVVRIGGFSSIMQSVIVPSLAPLFSVNPKLKLHITVDEMDNLPSMLHRGEIDYMILGRNEQREELERICLGKEKNVLVQRKKYNGPDVYLDHDENDVVTLHYLKSSGRKTKNIERQYLNNVYGLIEGVRHGLGRAVLPLHLISDEKDFEILDPGILLEIPVFLYFYSQAYYSKLHSKVIEAITKNSKALLD